MWVHVYVNSSRDLPSIKAAVEDHGCEVAGLEPGLYEVRVHDPNGDAEDEVTEYLNDAGIEAEVSYENPQTEGKPKAYDLLISGNLLSVVVNGKSGTIESGLPRKTCPFCGQADCCNHCDGSQGADDDSDETEQDAIDRTRYNAVLDAVESIILAHACAGIKVDDPKYIEGIETSLEAAGNALS